PSIPTPSISFPKVASVNSISPSMAVPSPSLPPLSTLAEKLEKLEDRADVASLKNDTTLAEKLVHECKLCDDYLDEKFETMTQIILDKTKEQVKGETDNIQKESQQIQSLVEAIAKQTANPPTQKEQAQAAPQFRAFDESREECAAQPMDIHVLQSQPAQKVAFKDSSTVHVGNKLVRNKPPTQPSAMRPKRNSNAVKSDVQTASDAGVVVPPARPTSCHLVRGGFQQRLPTSLPPPGQQQQPSPLPRRQPVPLMPPTQLHSGAPQVVAPAPAVPLQSPPPSELMDVDPSAGPPPQAVAVQPVLQPLSLGTPKESDTAAPCPAPTQQPSTQRQETLPLFVGPDAPSRPVPEAAPVVTAHGTPVRSSHLDLNGLQYLRLYPFDSCLQFLVLLAARLT
ncbi:YLP motif-containing protein 1-like, partial [Schistocerca americana]|uniref:YLP motif-containing protein 1-like n=1 Tax=Schistocerca americana TaxID=7009 RepID=UPI001F4FD32D